MRFFIRSVLIIPFILLSMIGGSEALPVSGESKQRNISYEQFIYPKEIQRFLILKPTGETKNDVSVLEVFSEDAENKKVVEELFEKSFMRESVNLYFLVQNYLINRGALRNYEPAYLLLSNEQGGFPKFSFYLREGKDYLDKGNVPYIELVKNNSREENYLWSMTQIYPHEMGHILYQMLSEITELNFPRSCDVHYSCMTSDFRFAFHEGIAIHFENAAREHEPNKELREAIFQDIRHKKKRVKPSIAGYIRDFKLPLRLDYFRTSVLVWYQNFEALKRHEWVKSGLIKYRNATIKTNNIEKALFYRNSGIDQDTTKIRNLQQALSTEGVIATFFTKLINSDLKNNYLPWDFYQPFLYSSKDIPSRPDELFSPLMNEYLKIFVVLNKHVNSNSTQQPQFLDFVSGYVKEFPEEKEDIYNIFTFATGYDVPNNVGPELWVLNREHKHRSFILDQFGSNVIPFYTFNLNAADVVDLLTIKDITREEAKKIIEYRDEKGFISGFDEIFSIPGVSQQTAEKLKNSVYDLEYMNKFEEEQSLNIIGLILMNLAHPFIKGLWIFVVFLVVYYFAFLRRQADRNKLTVKLILLKLLKMALFIFFGLVCIVFPVNTILTFLLIAIVFMAIEILVRRNRLKRKDALFTTSVIVVLILYSLW